MGLVAHFQTKINAIGNFIDRGNGRQKKRPLVETTDVVLWNFQISGY